VLRENDLSFTQVLEERRSLRKYGEQPITAEQLGEFLYRTARVRGVPETTQEGYERGGRPYPSGGGCCELELYVAVNVCEGLSAGLYYYCSERHQLHKMAGRTREVEELLQEAYHAIGGDGMPQVLIILAARFQRVAWKYSSIAYALVLKHVGVLYQTMYLVATAMGLAPCALGGGNSDIFAVAACTDYNAETSVGEFLLGSRAI
jgi:SagB-type dehydrogenase family enzyme